MLESFVNPFNVIINSFAVIREWRSELFLIYLKTLQNAVCLMVTAAF